MNTLLYGWLLRLSYSTERGAAAAYRGHASITDGVTRAEILQVRDDELEHRETLRAMLDERSIRPFPPFEWFFLWLGSSIALGCRVWGPRASALGASLFEIGGVLEYDRLASLAARLGASEEAAQLRLMADQERAHRVYFAALAREP